MWEDANLLTSLSMSGETVVVGAGIIGAAVAVELRRAGAPVLILDRQKPAGEATWAAAGMLSPTPESAEDPAMTRLSRASFDLYPQFIEAIEAESGIRVGYQKNGALLAFFGPGASEELKEHMTALARFGYAAESLSGEEVRRREPRINPQVAAGLWLSEEASLDNRALGRAAIVAAQHLGAELRTGAEVSRILVENGRSVGVMAGDEKISAGHVVVAAGCYSAGIEITAPYAPTRPVRGQMAALDAGAANPAVVLRSAHGYLVPREDGRLVAGSTVEHVGFDKSLTPDGLRRILDAAVEMVPGLGGAPVIETWAGLRPDSPDHLPILGPTPIEGLSIATGHYRSGILLAPITARLARQWLLGQPTDLPLAPFSPMRFAQSPAARAQA
jgi:glycine oxidase